MKVTFGGSFRDVYPIITASPKVEKQEFSFGESLENIAPDRPQPAVITQETKTPERPSSSPMARYTFAPPSLETTEQKPRVPAPVPRSEQTESVKTPTLISARRVNIGNTGFPEPSVAQVRELVGLAGNKHGVDPALGMAVIAAESSFNSQAVSRDGHESKGLFQLLDTTGKQVLERREGGESSQYDPFNPEMNVDLGVSHLRYLHETFSEDHELGGNLKTRAAANSASLEKLAVAAFNAGEGRVASAQSRAAQQGKDPTVFEQVEPYLPESTQDYVQRVLNLKRNFERDFITSS